MSTNAGVGGDVFGPDDFGSSKNRETKSDSTTTYNYGRKQTNFSKGIKLFALGAVSFAIPVFYYLQANELKKKELKVIESSRIKDTIESKLKLYYDTSIQHAKLNAYKAYSDQLLELLKPMIGDDKYESRFQEIENRFSSISNTLNNIENQISDLRIDIKSNNQYLGSLVSLQTFNTSIKTILDSIKILKNPGTIDNRSKNSDSFSRDSLLFASGQLDEYINRLSDMRNLYDTLTNNMRLNPRRIASQNQTIINLTKKTLDSLITSIKAIHRRLLNAQYYEGIFRNAPRS